MRKSIFAIFVLIMVFACEKENQTVQVLYKVSRAWSDTDITFRDGNENLITKTVEFQSGEDIWEYSFEGTKGDIVYISAIYSDSASSVKVQILLDGKIYKEGSSNNDPEKYVTVSGTIPY